MLFKKPIYISILLLLFTILQINNNNCYINQFSNDKAFKYKDYIKDKTLSENFHNQLLKLEVRKNISLINQNNSDDNSLCKVVFFSFINKISTQKIEFVNTYFKKHLNLTSNPRAPPTFSLYS